MSNLKVTKERFLSVCSSESQKPSAMILGAFDNQEKDISGEYPPEMTLRLAGNTRSRDNELLYPTRLTDEDAYILYQTLSCNIYVTALDVSYNHITDEGAKHIAKLIEETAALREVNLDYNEFGEQGAHFIAKALQNNETVQSIKMNGNKIGNSGGMAFAGMLQVNTTLHRLELGQTDLKTESLIALSTVLNYNNTLRALNVNRPLLFSQQEETTVHFANMLRVNHGLRELHLSKHDIRDFGMTRLSESLKENYTLTHLNLSSNRITRDGAEQLAACLRTDTPLEVLDLACNRIENDGAAHIADAVATFNTKLRKLAVSSNCISGDGLCALARCLEMNCTLEAVYIWGNKLDESACIAFGNLIQAGRLELKNTDVQPYTVDDVAYLAQIS